MLAMWLCPIATFAQALSWRGVMIDVSRHFMPLEDLRRQIDAMEHFGMNTLHLHLTDAAGWRLQIKSYPRLTDVGAWRTAPDWKTWWQGDRRYADSQTGHGGFYTQDEMRQLVRYAAERGVTIVPEIEFPAHSEEVVAAYPDLGFNHAEMDMQKEAVYTFMERVLDEVCDIFPSHYLHLGGDEAATQHDIQPMAMRRLKQLVEARGRRMVVWDEALSDSPADSTMVIMVWRNIDTARRAMELGHQVILCPGKWCYLDKCQDDPTREPKAAGGYLPIDSVYSLPYPIPGKQEHHPAALSSAMNGNATPNGMGCIIGIQANLWTEHIETPQYAEYMLWPRAFAIAELGKLGLDKPRNYKAFRKKALAATRYLRDTLGINAFPLDREIGERPERRHTMRSLCTHRPVQYLLPYHSYYPAAGDQTLTDGKCGGWNNTDGRWQGFIKGGMDVIIDLGKPRKISSIMGDFLQSTGPEIFLPYTMEIEVSQDSVNWKQLHKESDINSEQPEDYQLLGWKASAQQEKVRARYIRLRALTGPRQGWVFCDEVMVR